MISIEDLQKENKKLRANLSGVRGLLPKAAMPSPGDWFTIDEAADLLDLTSVETLQFVQGADLADDRAGRKCISREDLDQLLTREHIGGDLGAMAIRLAQGREIANTL